MDKYFMWIHYERLHNHNKAKHNKTVCIFLGIYCISHWNTDPWNNRKNCSTTGKVSQSENVMLQNSSYGGGVISVQLISMKLFGLKSRNRHKWSPFKPQLTQMYVFYLRGLVKLWSYCFPQDCFCLCSLNQNDSCTDSNPTYMGVLHYRWRESYNVASLSSSHDSIYKIHPGSLIYFTQMSLKQGHCIQCERKSNTVFEVPIRYEAIVMVYRLVSKDVCVQSEIPTSSTLIFVAKIRTITHCLGLGHETMGSTVCLSIFLRTFTEIQSASDILSTQDCILILWCFTYLCILHLSNDILV